MTLSWHKAFGQALVGMLLVALLSLPFAHRAGAGPVTPAMADYLALGGTWADLCGETGMPAAGGCESCLIAATMFLPGAAENPAQALTAQRLHDLRRTALLVPASAPFALPPARAPPVV